MGKRIFTVLLAISCCAVGIWWLRASGHSSLASLTTASQWLMRAWPLLIVLAGLVRVSNYLIDRQPRSPVGALLLIAIGGMLCVTQWRGETLSWALIGRYWFWFLLAYVLGRVLWQYTYRPADGSFKASPPRILSPGSVVIMLLIVGSGLASNYLTRNQGILRTVTSRIDELSANVLGESIAIEDNPAQVFTLPGNARVIVNHWRGDVEVRASNAPQPHARLVKHIRATNETQARAVAANIQLQIQAAANQLEFSLTTNNVTHDFTGQLILEIPAQTAVQLTLQDIRGDVTLRGTRGDHSLRDCGGITVVQQQGSLQIEAARGAIQVQDVIGDVKLQEINRDVVIDNLKGALTFAARAGNHRLTAITGTLQANLQNSRLELRNVLAPPQLAADKPLVFIKEARDSRLQLRDIHGATVINATRSRIEAESLTGDVSIQSAAESVNLAQITGKLIVKNENGSVTVQDLTGAGEIEAARDINVQNFMGTLNAETESGTITLTQSSELRGAITANTERGHIKLNFPADISFRLDASTESGNVRVKGFEGITTERRQTALTANHHATATSPLVTLRTVRGNIELRSTGTALASAKE